MTSKKHQKQTLRQRIAHALTDRKILHFRYDAHLRQQVYKRLNALQKLLINRISAIGVEALPAKKLDKLLTELQTEIAKTYQETTAYTRYELSGFLPLEAVKISQLYNDEIGFDLFNDVPKERIKAIKNVAVIEGQPLEAWWNKQRADLAFKFEGIIRTGVAEGKQNGQLATEVRELMSVSRRTADTLVITAVAKVADTAHEALRDANLDILQGEEHLSTLDMRTSTVCQVRDGKRWDLDKKPIGHNIPYKRPPLHPRCRSILQLVTKSWEELGVQGMQEMPTSTRASMDGPVDERVNYESWLNSKTAEEKEQILGKGKADLWQRGVITFSDMLDQSGRALTLRDLQKSYTQSWIAEDIYQRISEEVKNSPKIQAFKAAYNITHHEIVAMKAYTSELYWDLNQNMRNDNLTLTDNRFIAVVNQGLEKAPAYEGVTYRDTTLPDEVLEKYQIGKIVTEKAFTSSSIDNSLSTFKGNVRFIIQSKNGKIIEDISDYPDEREVLFKNKTQFKVLKRAINENVTEITLEEK
ncbi:ADP-ribosyltransferase domain-containing protein [Haemophilus parahaemolyticus]|uniref:ADP-ribosyltransferase domain-containing protein n=1 Tax=Haemophilus parahaemolyticus TaxID=735 RepID=UPI002490488C|nr:ADP-ribosyltransferase domain-containing protein [Haemophilus parahaemolyticus]